MVNVLRVLTSTVVILTCGCSSSEPAGQASVGQRIHDAHAADLISSDCLVEMRVEELVHVLRDSSAQLVRFAFDVTTARTRNVNRQLPDGSSLSYGIVSVEVSGFDGPAWLHVSSQDEYTLPDGTIARGAAATGSGTGMLAESGDYWGLATESDWVEGWLVTRVYDEGRRPGTLVALKDGRWVEIEVEDVLPN